MQMDSHNNDELWDLQMPNIPPRSRLFSLEPIGLGTPYVESLTGYVIRLAKVHSVTTSNLVRTEIASRLIKVREDASDTEITPKFGTFGSPKSGGALNGTGLMASKFVDALNDLTSRNDLSFLTMLPWKEVIPNRTDLSRHFKAWCPICYEEWHRTGQVIYEPLIWSLNVITICPVHHRPLETNCPHCHKKLLALEEKSQLGFCSKCRGWLGINKTTEYFNTDTPEDNIKWQLWVIENISNLIAAAPNLSSPSDPKAFQQVIRQHLEQEGLSYNDFSLCVGMSSDAVYRWCSGKKLPSFENSLQICYLFGTSLLDFFLGKVSSNDSIWQERQLQSQKLKRLDPPQGHDLNWELFRQTLIAALEECPPLKIADIIKRFGFLPTQAFYEKFPDLTKALKERYEEYQKTEREKIRQALLLVIAEDKHPSPSVKEVGERLGYGRHRIYSHFRDLYDIISARYASDRKKYSLEKVKQIQTDIKQAALELHSQGINPLSDKVKKLLSKPGIMRHKEAQATLRQVRYELGYETSSKPKRLDEEEL